MELKGVLDRINMNDVGFQGLTDDELVFLLSHNGNISVHNGGTTDLLSYKKAARFELQMRRADRTLSATESQVKWAKYLMITTCGLVVATLILAVVTFYANNPTH